MKLCCRSITLLPVGRFRRRLGHTMTVTMSCLCSWHGRQSSRRLRWWLFLTVWFDHDGISGVDILWTPRRFLVLIVMIMRSVEKVLLKLCVYKSNLTNTGKDKLIRIEIRTNNSWRNTTWRPLPALFMIPAIANNQDSCNAAVIIESGLELLYYINKKEASKETYVWLGNQDLTRLRPNIIVTGK